MELYGIVANMMNDITDAIMTYHLIFNAANDPVSLSWNAVLRQKHNMSAT